MSLSLSAGPLAGRPGAAVAVATRPGTGGPVPSAAAGQLAEAHGLDLGAVLERESAKGEPGEVVVLPLPSSGGATEGPATLLLAGVGDGGPAALRRAGAALARRARSSPTLVTDLALGAEPAAVRALAEGLLLASYRFTLKREPAPVALTSVELVVDDPAALEPLLARAVTTAAATRLARDLVNTPALDGTPAWLAEQAAGLGHGLAVRIREPGELAAEGFGGILAVGMGSDRPPRLIEVVHAPPGARRSVVLIGKGITFDSGGLSLKTNEGMVSMKTDMAGGAAVLGAIAAVAELGVTVHVTALVPAAENMPSGSAQRPGDVITHPGGTTTEVFNTDAEGRLVLADALAYTARELRPDVVVDLATLTGAMPLALGRRTAGLFANDDRLAAALLSAADEAGERLWRMPLVEDYRDTLDSEVADLSNIGRKGYSGGAIVAALYLREFVGGLPWAHLDIAGPARADGDDDEVTKGGTGYGVRLLVRWLEALAAGPAPRGRPRTRRPGTVRP